MNKKKLTIILSVVVVLVLALSVGVIAKISTKSQVSTLALKGTPQEIVTAALYNTNAKLTAETEALNVLTGKELMAAIMAEEAVSMDMNGVFKGLSGVESASMFNAIMKDAGLNANLAYSLNGEKINFTVSAAQGRLEFLSLTGYKEGAEVGIDIPQLFTTPYAINLETLYEDLQTSPILEIAGIDPEMLGAIDLGEVSEAFNVFREYLTVMSTLGENSQLL